MAVHLTFSNLLGVWHVLVPVGAGTADLSPDARLDLECVPGSPTASQRKSLLKMNMSASIGGSSKVITCTCWYFNSFWAWEGSMLPVISLKIKVACCKAWMDLAWMLAPSWLPPQPLPLLASTPCPRPFRWSQIYCHWPFSLFHSSFEKVC